MGSRPFLFRVNERKWCSAPWIAWNGIRGSGEPDESNPGKPSRSLKQWLPGFERFSEEPIGQSLRVSRGLFLFSGSVGQRGSPVRGLSSGLWGEILGFVLGIQSDQLTWWVRDMDLNLRGDVTIVTGGASGIGRAVAEGFLSEGSPVAIWDFSQRVEEVGQELSDRFQIPVPGLRVDVTDREGIQGAVRETTARLGVPRHVVHCAGIGSGKFGFPFTNLSPEDWPATLEVNIMGMVNVAHALTPLMVEAKAGTMIFIASVAGQMGSQTDPPYSAAKAANINFAQCMAKDLAPHGIRVNTICPGMIQTPLNRGVWQAWNDQQPVNQQRSYEEWGGEKVSKVVPLGRWQEPRDVADMALFLSSERAMNVTGQTINVDGGFVMHW